MNDPDMGSWSYAYDALGNLTYQRDAKGQVTCLYYDNLNRLKEKNYQGDLQILHYLEILKKENK
jgi:YD repeat-containing protein